MEKEDSYLSIISDIIFFGLAMLQYVFIALIKNSLKELQN